MYSNNIHKAPTSVSASKPINNLSNGSINNKALEASDTSVTEELNEYELKEFTKQVKDFSDVNKFDQNAFIPSTDHIIRDKDYYEGLNVRSKDYESE